MNRFDQIKPYDDSEVNKVLQEFKDHPFMKALLLFTFPNKTEQEYHKTLMSCHSISDLQKNILSLSVQKALRMSSEGVTTTGFESLSKDQAYLYISNHRDIVLDTSILNVILLTNGLITTASAIGDNLIKRSSLLKLSRLSRNFVIFRELPPRESLEHSKLVSEYVKHLISNNRSVWMAERQGRTKDGNDELQQGVLKMLIMERGEKSIAEYVESLNPVITTVSYEFDPTDMLKIPELLAKHYDEKYIKTRNEDFNTILKGVLGYKGRIHLSVRGVKHRIREICKEELPVNEQLQCLKEFIDRQIHMDYKLWPSNYIAYDMLYGATYTGQYTDKEKRQFERRVEKRIRSEDKISLNNFLKMYATPVINAHKHSENQNVVKNADSRVARLL